MRAQNYQEAAARLKIAENAKAEALSKLEEQFKGKADSISKAELLVGTKHIEQMNVQSQIDQRFARGECLVCGSPIAPPQLQPVHAYPCEDSTYFYLCDKHASKDLLR